jgi:hypothetical protein
MVENKTELIRPFGASILKARLPHSIIEILNKDCLEIGNDEELRTNLDWSPNLAGRVKWEYKIRDEAVAKISEYVAGCAKALLVPLDAKDEHAEFFKYIEIGLLSSVGYLSLPSDIEEFWKEEDTDHNSSGGHIEWISGQMGLTNNTRYKVKPKVGDFYIFPAYLDHTVYPFNSKFEPPDPQGERRSFSMNITYRLNIPKENGKDNEEKKS